MTTFLLALTAFFHVLLPLLLIAWMAFGKTASVAHYAFRALWSVVYVLTITAAGVGWGSFGMWLRPTLMIATLVAMAVGIARTAFAKPPLITLDTWRQRVELIVSAGLFALLFSSMRELASRRVFNEQPVTLRLPLSSGDYAVLHGGSKESMNHHAPVPAQRYALDIVALDGMGKRAQGLGWPDALSGYASFGKPVVAPCDGEIISAEGALDDQAIGTTNEKAPAGNHIALHCQGVTVLLAHLQRGSVTLTVGATVKTGQALGLIGNSGNTSEPHLHVHAVRGKVSDYDSFGATGEAVPIVFERFGFLARNDVVTL